MKEVFDLIASRINDAYKEGYQAGLRMAEKPYFKALQQEPCEDAISRQGVIDTLTKTGGIRGDVLKALYDLPPVTPQPKTGHWIKTKEQNDAEPLILWKCSECLTIYRLKTKYCPNCGAKMEVEK